PTDRLTNAPVPPPPAHVPAPIAARSEQSALANEEPALRESDDGIPSYRRIGLLRARLGQPIHRFDRAQDVHVCNAFALGIRAWLDMCSGEDCDDAILNIA